MVDHVAASRSISSGWLALAIDGPALDLPGLVAGTPVRVVPDVPLFVALLEQARPRICLLGTPPAARPRRSSWRASGGAGMDCGSSRFPRPRPWTFASRPCGSASMRPCRARSNPASSPPASPCSTNGRAAAPAGPSRSPPAASSIFAHELRRDGRLVHLRPKEFDLLAVLASHPGRAWTRRQLLDRAWGHGHDGDPRTIDVHVRWLRSKIETEPEQPAHLVTVRGVGYRLDPPGR